VSFAVDRGTSLQDIGDRFVTKQDAIVPLVRALEHVRPVPPEHSFASGPNGRHLAWGSTPRSGAWRKR
jgi:hypothetical protein